MVLRLFACVGLAAVLSGCMHQQVRSQKADEPEVEPQQVRTVGDLTVVSNAMPIPVIGVGLVTGLPGTGGGVPPGNERAQLENDLKKLGVTNIQELFRSKGTSLVRVAATIPPGARKGDPVDIFVNVPEGCRTTSLRNGKLEVCYLYSFENSRNISLDPTRPDRLLRGHALVKAEGAVLAGLPTDMTEDAPSAKVGKVWGGGKVQMADRPFVLEIHPPSVKTAVGIAERVNETFHGPGSSASAIASAKNDTHVMLAVPGAYRLNMARFLRVVRLIPLEETPMTDSPYCQRLFKQLQDPPTCMTAALRLEALGQQSVPMLKLAMNSDDAMVRFASAEALAYLGSPACAEELAKQSAEQPLVQAYSLSALASLNEAICRVKLQELLSAPSPEARYGAFRALRTLDERDPAVAGDKVGGFWLHSVAANSAPQVHLSTGKRPEVVLFGTSPRFVPPVSLLAGEFTVTAADGDETCTISRFSVKGGQQSRRVTGGVAEVLRALAELGGTYVDAMELLRQADNCRALNCAVKVDALPKAPSVQDLARMNSGPAGGDSRPDIGPAPALYDSTDTARVGLAAARQR